MTPNHPSVSAISVLRGSVLLRGVTDAALSKLAAGALPCAVPEGEYLWHAEDIAHYFTIITRGLVRVQKRTPRGEDAIVGIFGPRESVGDTAALQQAPYPADAIAFSERVEVMRLPVELVREGMRSDESMAQAVQRALIQHSRTLQAKIDVVSAGSVNARLCTLLVQLAERFGDENEEGVTVVPVPLSRAALSQLVSARVETVIRTLSALQKRGLVQTTKDGFELGDLEGLRQLASEG